MTSYPITLLYRSCPYCLALPCLSNRPLSLLMCKGCSFRNLRPVSIYAFHHWAPPLLSLSDRSVAKPIFALAYRLNRSHRHKTTLRQALRRSSRLINFLTIINNPCANNRKGMRPTLSLTMPEREPLLLVSKEQSTRLPLPLLCDNNQTTTADRENLYSGSSVLNIWSLCERDAQKLLLYTVHTNNVYFSFQP